MAPGFEQLPPMDPTPPAVEIQCSSTAILDLRYAGANEFAAKLYAKGRQAQWNADERIDWRTELDPDNLLSFDDRLLPIHASQTWRNASSSEQVAIRNRYHGHALSQLLHGEQAALVAAGQLVQVLPTVTAKQFAAQQAADEARHVDVLQSLMTRKAIQSFELDPGIEELVRKGLADPRWDFVVLTTQVLIEGLALGLLQQLRDFSRNPLIKAIATNIMADESRHVAYGLRELEEHYRQLTDSELRERAEFARDGLDALLRRLNPAAAWKNLGLPEQVQHDGQAMSAYRRTASQLSARVDTMLEKLRLREGRGVDFANDRLAAWDRADHQVLSRQATTHEPPTLSGIPDEHRV